MADRAELLSELTQWAAERYPDRTKHYPGPANPLPASLAGFRPSEADLSVLFANTTSAEHHLALVDLPVIREALERLPRNSPVRVVVRTSWQRHLAAARARA